MLPNHLLIECVEINDHTHVVCVKYPFRNDLRASLALQRGSGYTLNDPPRWRLREALKFRLPYSA